MRHVVMFSGGAGSWAAAKRVAERHGTDDLVLLFADTKAEERDVYRFRDEAAANAGGELVIVADGRDPWQVFRDDRFLGNSRLANCSKYLKQIPCRQWLEAHCHPEHTTVYVGIDWTESHRLDAIEAGYGHTPQGCVDAEHCARRWDKADQEPCKNVLSEPWPAEAPLCEPPYLAKDQVLEWLRREGLEPPAPYAEGFPHANCASACVRGGQAQWALLWRKHPDRYAAMERNEQGLREHLDAEVAILRDRTDGESRPMTLREFREQRLEPGGVQGAMFDGDEWGGCGCLPSEVPA